MVFCVHATARLHATDTAISVRCASKEARSCNFCSQWFSVFCVHATATLHATDAAISVRCASKEARSCNFCSEWFSVCMPRQGSMQQIRQYQSGVQAKRHAAAIFVVNGFLLLCACHGKAPCNRCGNIRCASKPRWRKKDTQLRYLLCLIICLHAMATFHATDTTMLVVNVDTTMLVVNLGGGEYIVAAKSLLPWFCQE